MPRYPADRSIRRRVVLAYHRAQALARNQAYASDIAKLRADGYTFDDDGVERLAPWDELSARARAIRKRTALRRLMTPERLRTVTVEQIAGFEMPPVFADVLGWEMRRVPGPVPGARKVPDLTGDPVLGPSTRWYVNHPVRPHRLTARHRDLGGDPGPPHDLYSTYWTVHDLRQQGKREREIITTLWPHERSRQSHSSQKNYLRQRVYDYDRRARELIARAYPEPAPDAPHCSWCQRPLRRRRPTQRFHSRCSERRQAAQKLMRAKIRRARRKAERELARPLERQPASELPTRAAGLRQGRDSRRGHDRRAVGGAKAKHVSRLLQELKDLAVRLRSFAGKDWHSLSTNEDNTARILIGQYDRLVLRLARHGVRNHPLVAGWLENLRILGQRALLRKARAGLEKGVRRPISPQELDLWYAIDTRREQGQSMEGIRKALVAEGLISPRVTRRGLQQRFDSLSGLRDRRRHT